MEEEKPLLFAEKGEMCSVFTEKGPLDLVAAQEKNTMQ